jgi:hypothetical protein
MGEGRQQKIHLRRLHAPFYTIGKVHQHRREREPTYHHRHAGDHLQPEVSGGFHGLRVD